MGVPSTTGKLSTSLDNMEVGDYIVCKYVATSGTVGTFSEFGTSVATELAVSGAISAPNGTFYFVKIDKGLFVADRKIQTNISWDTLNTGKVIQGLPVTLGGKSGVIRVPTGGVAHLDANGNMSLAYQEGYGAYPTNNEWDKYISNFDSKLIQSGKTLDDIFHWSGTYSWCQDTTVNGFYHTSSSWYTNSIVRTLRGNTLYNKMYSIGSNTSVALYGFRPVFAYNEI